MSLTNSPDYFLRPEDQALKQLFPTIDHNKTNYFDDFFNEDLYEGNRQDDRETKQETNEWAYGFALETSANDIGLSPRSRVLEDPSKQLSPQPWRKGVWSLKPASQLVIGKTRRTAACAPPSIAPNRLVVEDDSASQASHFSRPKRTKSASPIRLQRSCYPSASDKQSLARDASLSPMPMYSRSFAGDKHGFVDVWQQEFDLFNLDLNDEPVEVLNLEPETQFSYSHYRKLQCRSDSGDYKRAMEGARAATMHVTDRPVNFKVGANTSASNLNSIMNANFHASARNMFSGTPDPHDKVFRFINGDLPPMSDWTTSDSSHSSRSETSHLSAENLQAHSVGRSRTLWSPQDTVDDFHTIHLLQEPRLDILQPEPRRPAHQLLNSEYYDQDGLGIKYPSSDEIGVALPYMPPQQHVSGYQPAHVEYHMQNSGYTNALDDVPALPHPSHTFDDESPFTTPRRRRVTAPSRSPSLSPSRTRRASRSRGTQQTSPNRGNREVSQHRSRKSINKNGPIKGNETPRHRSTSRPPRTPQKTPRTPGDAFGQMGFVNFTPKDASKLLNDVAPSGSSKTRARREQEAREKRKKLSEAALAAVRQAGGDVEALERAILI